MFTVCFKNFRLNRYLCHVVIEVCIQDTLASNIFSVEL